ncbi:MAG: DUF1648 domain-containing protein, partial [Cyanobacteria bacterium REEB65]|nr:DUF1648 domain-containing protein [Cyanobacteria bacterium REEB65]
MSSRARNEVLPVALVLASWALAAWFWPLLPQRVPTHWGVSGQPNGWMSMPWGGLIGPLVTTSVYILLSAIPILDPRRQHWETTLRFYPAIKTTMVAFMVAVNYLALSAAT